MAVASFIFLLGVSLVLSIPLPKKECSSRITVADKEKSVSDVLKSHQCSPTQAFTTFYSEGVSEIVKDSIEGQDICIGLADLVSYGVEMKVLDDICSKATFKDAVVSENET